MQITKVLKYPVLAALTLTLALIGIGVRAQPEANAAWQKSEGFFSYRTSPDAKGVSADRDHLKLQSGDVLLDASKHTTVELPLATVLIPHRALVYLKAKRSVEHVFVLCDNASATVEVIYQKHKVKLAAGEEVAVSASFPKYQQLTADDVGRRRITAHSVGDENYMVTSEFSLMHTFESLPLMQSLSHSDDSHDHSVKEMIIKTAAVLEQVQHAHGSYYRGGSQ